MKQSELYSDILQSNAADELSETENLNTNTIYTIRDAYDDWKSHLPTVESSDEYLRKSSEFENQKYQEALDLAEKAEYVQSDLLAFFKLDWKKEWEDDFGGPVKNSNIAPGKIYDGIFASALVEALDEDQVRLPDMSDVRKLGYRTTTDITVEGDVGSKFGVMVEEGELRAEGDVASTGFAMRGGEIIVEGDCDSVWDADNKVEIKGNLDNARGIDGELIVKGNLEEINGEDRFEHEGEIYVEGEIGSIDEGAEGTEVFQNQNGNWEQVFP